MEETTSTKVVHAVVFLAICFAILFIGWREPIRYRFMSADQIAAEYAPPRTPAPVDPSAWMKDPRRKTSLDRGAYGRSTRDPNARRSTSY